MAESNEITVSIKNLNKTYKIYDTPGQRFRSLLFKRDLGRDFVALDGIDLDIARGEAFAVIGKNGSGKSTMLQILAGILKPTAGEVRINGRIAALLELGSGFNPESTGYENIYMNAAVLGLQKDEIERKVNDIIEFADIGDHIHEPVKTYSSGMYVRLGFAVAINVDADILLVDEALAVGDVFFRQKCYSRLNELKKNGTTIILVTHNMSEVEQFCDRAVLLQQGKQVAVGRSQDVVKEYYIRDNEDKKNQAVELKAQEKEEQEEKDWQQENSDGKFQRAFKSGWKIQESVFYDLTKSKEVCNGKAFITKVGLFNEHGEAQRAFQQGEWGYFYIEVEVKEPIEIPIIGIFLYNQFNIIVHGKDTCQTYTELPQKVPKGSIIAFLQTMKFDIAVGEYSFEIGLASISQKTYRERSMITQEMINAGYESLCVRNNVGVFSIIEKQVGTPTKMAFHGNCDLPGETELCMRGAEENDC